MAIFSVSRATAKRDMAVLAAVLGAQPANEHKTKARVVARASCKLAESAPKMMSFDEP